MKAHIPKDMFHNYQINTWIHSTHYIHYIYVAVSMASLFDMYKF